MWTKLFHFLERIWLIANGICQWLIRNFTD